MLDKIQRQNKIVEDQVRAQQLEAGYGPGEADDDMGVSIGNTFNNTYQVPEKSKGSLLKKLVVGAVTLAAGGAAGFATSLLLGSAEPPPAAVDTDTDTLTDVMPGFGVPQYKE